MNFLGHAMVARWHGDDPLLVLGSMLPDFASMVGARLARARPAGPLSDGIALHHRTDDAFHGATTFTRLVQETTELLCAAGVPRGGARAVGHVGTELLIDGELLLREEQLAETYRGALVASARAPEGFADEAARARFLRLCERLIAHGPPHEYRDPERVAARLELLLAPRPRLALGPEGGRAVRAALPALQRQVVASLAALLDELRARLDETRTGAIAYFPS